MVDGEEGKGPVPEPTYPKRQLTENSASLRGNNESGILYRDPENTCSVVGQRAENHERDRPTTRRPSGTGREQGGGNTVSINQRVRPRFTNVWHGVVCSFTLEIGIRFESGQYRRGKVWWVLFSRCPSCACNLLFG